MMHRVMLSRRALVGSALIAALPGCSRIKRSIQPAGNRLVQGITPPIFEEVTHKAGISWVHNPCRTGKKYLPETVGSGGGFIDYNNDGFLDILLINGAPLPGYKGPVPSLALYHNNGDGTFIEVTRDVGLNVEEYGLGLAVGDYDNDGWPDIYFTTLGGNRLFHNDKGIFHDVTSQAGVGIHSFSTGAAWIDYDRDGHLDLFVGNYVDWSPQTDLPCGSQVDPQYCPPYQYRAARPYLFRNCGEGSFEDVSERSGVLGHAGKTLGVTIYDFDGDGWPDIYLANDTEPDVLLINNQKGSFTDQALAAGVAVGLDGNPTGSMGVDVSTPFNDGRAAIAVGTFAGQELSLFVQVPGASQGQALFDNQSAASGIANATQAVTTFGVAFADFDLDGWIDLLAMNGHIDNDQSLSIGGIHVPYRQKLQLFQNHGDGTFHDVAEAAGLSLPLVGRGLAIGDFNNDGLPDLLTFENGGPVRLWRNVSAPAGSWLGVILTGSRSSRDGSGAMVTLYSPGCTQSRCATTARSYLSACDPRIHFGVGNRIVERLEIVWPSGVKTVVNTPPLNRYLSVREDEKLHIG